MRIIEIYDTTDKTDPSNPIEKKGVTYVDKNHIKRTIFVLPEELEARIKELKSS